MPIELKFVGDVADLIRGIESGEKSLDDLRETLGQVGDAGEDAGEDAGDALADIGEETESAGMSMRGLGSITKQVLEGDVVGAAKAALPMLSQFGPVAQVAGTAAYAALSLIQTAIEGSSKAAQADAGEAAKWAQAWLTAGGDVISSQQIVAGIMAITNDPDRYAEAEKNATNWGVTVAAAMNAMAGDATALAVVQESLNGRQAEYNAFLEENFQVVNFGNAATAEEVNLRAELFNSIDAGTTAYAKLTAEMEQGREQANNTSEALLLQVQAAEKVTKEVDALGNILYSLPDGAQIVVNAETGLASQNLADFKGDVDGFVETVATKGIALVPDTTALDKELAKPRRVIVRVGTANGRMIIE